MAFVASGKACPKKWAGTNERQGLRPDDPELRTLATSDLDGTYPLKVLPAGCQTAWRASEPSRGLPRGGLPRGRCRRQGGAPGTEIAACTFQVLDGGVVCFNLRCCCAGDDDDFNFVPPR
jgi:hypothetical protein